MRTKRLNFGGPLHDVRAPWCNHRSLSEPNFPSLYNLYLRLSVYVRLSVSVGVYSHKQNISGSTGFSDTKRQGSRIHPKNWSEKGSVGFLKKPLSKDKATGKTVHEGHVFCVGHADLTTNA